VNLETAGDFIRNGAAALGVGADLVDVQALRRGDGAVLTEKARAYIRVVREAREGT
jgi:2-dehydro-3-deoxyphosphogluconate aldolase/(4S)-4-hydroxy-2-oxoglutarate aldolase